MVEELYSKLVEERLIVKGPGFYRLYPDQTGIIAEVEVRALEMIGYKFIVVGIEDGKFYTLFEKRND